MTVDVLGTKYTITESNKVKDNELNNGDGYCDHSTKQIVIDTFQDSPGSLADLETYRQHVIRHELVHAFLFESGLGADSWGINEESRSLCKGGCTMIHRKVVKNDVQFC